MRIVVTGASGNVGTALLRRLAERRADDHVVGICRRRPPDVAPYDGAEWVELDLTSVDAESRLTEVVRGADAVVHLAWAFQPGRDVGYLERVGVGGTTAVLHAVAATHVPHLVHMSSVGTYAPTTGGVFVDETWPTSGVRSSPYSRHKAAAEALLDRYEHTGAGDRAVVTRLRPGLIGQAEAGSALLRYAVPSFVPATALRWVPVVPLDRRFAVPLVHADDVATAAVTAVERRAGGAFNLAADPPVDRGAIARALDARPVGVPRAMLRAAAALAWRTRVSTLDPGWLDLAFAVPLLDTRRARERLDWTPERSATEVLADVVAGLRSGWSGRSAPLRERSVVDNLTTAARSGPVTRRREP